MKVTKIEIKNVMGLRDAEISPKQVTLVSGKNGIGKTSIMAAISSVITGGHDATLLRNGEESGESVIVIDDNITLKKSIGESKSSLDVSLDGRNISSPASYVKDLFGTGFNPIKFLSMADKDRIGEMLKALPITLGENELQSIIGSLSTVLDSKQHPLKQIDQAHTLVFDERRQINRIVSEAEKTISSLSAGIIAVNDDADIEIASISEEIQEIDAEIAKLNERKSVLRSDLARVNQMMEASAKQKAIKDEIERMNKSARENGLKSLALSDQLEKLNRLKQSLTSQAKISGMSIEINEGALYIDGVQFDRLNTAKRIQVALEIASNNMGKIRFAVVDGAECLDSETLDLFAKIAKDKNIQLLLFAVSDDENMTIREV